VDILLPENKPFNLNQPTNKLIDSKMCVFDYADRNDMDFYFKKITTYILYRYPTVELSIGDKYTLEIPLNWRVMITNSHDYLCQLIPVEELLHFEHQTPIFNPYYIGIPKIMDITIKSVNQTAVEHFVPKLPKKNLLVMPVGNKNLWDNKIVNHDTKEVSNYPDCIMACDDIDTSKCELALWDDIIS
jgi:hypothetical protein